MDNIGDEPLPFLWAAHPQFQVNEPTRVILPDEMNALKCVYGGLQRTVGVMYPMSEIDLVDPTLTKDGTKYYYPGAVPQGWSELHGHDSGSYLLLTVDPRNVPH